jgi:hypothetical protein
MWLIGNADIRFDYLRLLRPRLLAGGFFLTVLLIVVFFLTRVEERGRYLTFVTLLTLLVLVTVKVVLLVNLTVRVR